MPSADKVLYELAWALKSQDKEKEAADVFAQLAAQCPTARWRPRASIHVGEFAYKAGDFRTAAAGLPCAADKAGKSELGEKATHKLAWAYYRMDDVGDAGKTFRLQRATWPARPAGRRRRLHGGRMPLQAEEIRGGPGRL